MTLIHFITALATALFACATCGAADDGATRAAQAGRTLIGQPAPAAVLRTLDGGTIDLATRYGRKPVYLKFWATWCAPCPQQMPGFERIHRQYGNRIDVIGVNAGFNDTEADVRAYRTRHGLTMPIALVFFSPWCETYLRETRPATAQACRRVREDATRLMKQGGVDWLAVAAPLWTSAPELAAYAKAHPGTPPLALDRDGAAFAAFGIRAIPSVVLLDADGRVARVLGPEERGLDTALRAVRGR